MYTTQGTENIKLDSASYPELPCGSSYSTNDLDASPDNFKLGAKSE